MTRKTRNGMTFEGEPTSANECPIAVWLREEPTFREACVSSNGHAAVYTTNLTILSINCDAIREFVRWFDG